eukprot:2498906-Prymnesium_polylepis.2
MCRVAQAPPSDSRCIWSHVLPLAPTTAFLTLSRPRPSLDASSTCALYPGSNALLQSSLLSSVLDRLQTFTWSNLSRSSPSAAVRSAGSTLSN